MTRINVVPVTELHNKHLLAEYRELPRLYELSRKWSKRVNARRYKGPYREIPTQYRLGKGHVLFFYDKLGYIARRHRELYDECRRRGYRVNFAPQTRQTSWAPEHLMNDYDPTAEALRINRERIAERLATMRV